MAKYKITSDTNTITISAGPNIDKVTSIESSPSVNIVVNGSLSGATALTNISSVKLSQTATTAMFQGNEAVTDIQMNMNGVENADAMFGSSWYNQGQRASADTNPHYCTALTSVNLSNVGSVKSAKGMFCRAGLSSFSGDFANLIDAESMFGVYHHNDNLACFNLTSCTLGSLSKLENASKMFGTAKNLKSFSANCTNLKNSYRMFNGCSSLTSLTLGNLSNLENAGNMFYSAGLETISFTETTALTNASYFAAYMTNVTSITLNCDNVTNAEGIAQFITHPFVCNFGSMSKVENGSQMFTSSKIQSFSAEMTSLVNGDYMFGGIWAGCANCTVESVNLGSTPNLTSAVQMFSGATQLKDVVINDCSNLTSYTDMFKGCTALTSVTMTGLPSTLQNAIKAANTDVPASAWHF